MLAMPPLGFPSWRKRPVDGRRSFLFSSLVFLLLAVAIPPLWATLAVRQDEDPETAFARKTDKLLKIVRRTAAEARAQGRFPAQEIEKLSESIAVEPEIDGGARVGVVVELKAADAEEVRAAGFEIGAQIGRILTVEADVEDLPRLAALGSVQKISGGAVYRPLNDLARRSIGIDNASGQRVVSQTGRGVVVGIVDSGIDFRHPDFTLPGSNGRRTRIKALLDMTVYGSGATDPAWNYTLPGGTTPIGRLYTEDEINAALEGNGNVQQRDRNGHGTHVAGTAAGNGLAGPTPGLYTGMAPEADLIIVKANRKEDGSDGFRTTDIINAMRFIEQKAGELGKPFVINLSIGGHQGPHDGTNPDERAIDEIVSRGPGRAVCVAAGNEGDNAIHASGSVTAGNSLELRLDSEGKNPRYVELYYSKNDRLSVTVTRPDGVQVGPVPYNPSGFINGANGDTYIRVYNATDDKGDADPSNDQNNIFVVFNDSAKDLGSNWTLTLRGDSTPNGGRFDAWLGDGHFLNNVDDSKRVSSPGTARGAITVGAYITRSSRYTVGDYAPFTSPGPTADGRPKPEISAPGYYLYSAKSADSSFGSANPAPGDSFHSGAAGTSMATPVVTGAVALLLQANPHLDSLQIKRFLTNYAQNDNFALPGWDPRFGYGKLNVAAAINAAMNLNGGNSIDDSAFFVRQQYLDFLNRFPEASGFNDWLRVLNNCGSDQQCLQNMRIEVSASFFRSEEFFVKGYYVYRFYTVSFGRMPRYVEMVPDMRAVTGQTAEEVIAKREAFARNWVERADFKAKYGGLTNEGYVDALLRTAGVSLSNRDQLINDLNTGRRSRADVLKAIVESTEVAAKEYNSAFVAMQYFGYLRRDPEPAGYQDWLRVLNRNPQDYRTMVWGFVNSTEYRLRFGYR